MNWKKLISLTLVILLVIAIAGLAIAQKEDKDKETKGKGIQEQKRIRQMEPGKPADPFDRIANRLGIKPETLEKLRDIHRNLEKKNIRLQADFRIAQMDLMDVIKSSKSPDTEIRKAADNVAKIQSQIIQTRIDALLQAKKLLTPEQYERMIRVMGLMHIQGGPSQMIRQRRMLQQGPGMGMQGMKPQDMQDSMGQGGFGRGPQFGFNPEFNQPFPGEFAGEGLNIEQSPFFAQRPFPDNPMMEQFAPQGNIQNFEEVAPTPEE